MSEQVKDGGESVSRDLLAIGVRARNIEITRQQRAGEPNNEDHALRIGIAAALAVVPHGEVRLWDTQWMNIVNHDNCYRDWDKEDAINHAVRMTEQAIARNVADGKLPPSRIAAREAKP